MKYLFLLTPLLFIACSNISERDLEGTWTAFPSDSVIIYDEIKFYGDSVELIDEYSFKEKGRFSISSNDLTLHLKNRDISTHIESLISDTLSIFNEIKYIRNAIYTMSDFPVNELIGIETDLELEKNSKIIQLPIHLSKDKSGELTLRYHDKSIYFEDLPLLFEGHNQLSSSRELILFITKDINLLDLKRIYTALTSTGTRKVKVVTAKSPNSYFYFTDKVDFWFDDYISYIENINSPPPPLPPFPDDAAKSKEEFLQSGATLINISSLSDLDNLNTLKIDEKYLISIKSSLGFENYIIIKKKVNELRKMRKYRIKTEID
jgi:hypothetical protein